MKQIVEFGVFLAIAAGSHFALFREDMHGAVEAAGNEGAEILTLAASSEALSAMVQTWERPVEMLQQVALPPQQSLQNAIAPKTPSAQPDMPVRPASPPSLQAVTMPAPDLPTIDTAPPPQPSFAATRSARPMLRPPAPVRAIAQPAAQEKPKSSTTKQASSAKRQVAAGAGNGKAAGKKKQAKAPAKRQASSPAAMARWGGSIRSAVERRKKYPANTRARGRVVLAVAVSSSGKLSSVRVKRSSGNAALDKAALTAVKRARFKAAPRGVKSGVHHFSLPISFSR